MAEAELPKSSSNGGLLLLAENLLEKLKIANYDTEYCYKKNTVPFAKTFFTEPNGNGNSQWAAFLGLVSWIMKEIGNEFNVDKYDDPNTSSNKLMLSLKQLNFQSDFPVTRLKQGYGQAVCEVLDFLADKLLKSRGFKFNEPQYPETDGFEEAEVDDADLGTTDIVDEAIESEEEDVLYTENVRGGGGKGRSELESKGNLRGEDGFDMESKESTMLEGEQSPEFLNAWRAELERVTPRLKRKLQSAGNEWRAHLEQVKTHDQTIQKALPECTQQLNQINIDLTDTLERISNKETFLSNSFEHIGQDYRKIQERLKTVTQDYETASDAVEKLSSELSTITEALDELKGDMDTKGNSMVDTSPLQKIRKALNKLKAEIMQMELRIGVVGHSLLQASLHSAQEARNKKAGANNRNPEEVRSPPAFEGFESSPRSPTGYDLF